jgi:hypothetical protein
MRPIKGTITDPAVDRLLGLPDRTAVSPDAYVLARKDVEVMLGAFAELEGQYLTERERQLRDRLRAWHHATAGEQR